MIINKYPQNLNCLSRILTFIIFLQLKKVAMLVTCVYVNVKPDVVDRFVSASLANHLESVKEPGNLRFDIIRQVDDPCRFMLYEAYENEDAAANHKTTPHYLKWRDTVKDYMAEPRLGVKYFIIEPTDKTKW
jgi:autoinducer 2-degrading protein